MMTMRDPFRGMRRSLILSVGAGVLMAVVGLLERSIYLAAMFGILAAGSFQLLEGERRRSPPRDSWRR
jgi:Flp pilus assembly protein TadB